jgi:Asp-tRNA(Asn)/Glu-tRNA(Gln) amidotransferase A subunit family amidase
MARTVADAVAIFDVIAGYDAADPVTAANQGKRADLPEVLDKDGVRGTRLGVVRRRSPSEYRSRRHGAWSRRLPISALGATIVDPITIAEIDNIPPGMLFCFRFKFDINEYLPRLAPTRR